MTNISPKKRPEVLRGITRKMNTGCGNIYVTINEDEEGRFFEIFTSMGKAGGCASSQAEALGRLISLALRSNIEPDVIVKQLKGISCQQPQWGKGGKVLSCADALAKAIEMYKNPGLPLDDVDSAPEPIKIADAPSHIGACPDCGGAVEHEGGCAVCHNCGWSKCA
ncbi:MAG: TSCPD domain-containing protein [Actinomycetota bacterium]|nr:TSCPD domain-containing protein [Actinomycetota bacterium]